MFRVVIKNKVIRLIDRPVEEIVDRVCNILQVTNEDLFSRDLVRAVTHEHIRMHYLGLPFAYSSTVRDALLSAEWVVSDTDTLAQIKEAGEEVLAQFPVEMDGHRVGDYVTYVKNNTRVGPIAQFYKFGPTWGVSMGHTSSWFPLNEIEKCL